MDEKLLKDIEAHLNDTISHGEMKLLTELGIRVSDYKRMMRDAAKHFEDMPDTINPRAALAEGLIIMLQASALNILVSQIADCATRYNEFMEK